MRIFLFFGRTKDLFDNLLTPLGINWTVTLNSILFTQAGKSSHLTAVILNESSGLIHSPIKTDKGVDATSLLNPLLLPDGFVKIESRSIENTLDGRTTDQLVAENNGFYKIINVKHVGQLRGRDFSTHIECTEL